MIKKCFIISCFVSTILFANESNEIKKATLSSKAIESQNKAIEKQAINKFEIENTKSSLSGTIVVSDKTITVENNELKNKILELLKNDFMIKNPNVRLEIEEPTKITLDDYELDGCKSCHGYQFDKAALGSSKLLSKMSKEEILEALNGYKDGTYGSSMKSMMRTQVMKYTDEELKLIAEKISNAIEIK